MKNKLLLLFALILLPDFMFSQTANWSAVSPAYFPSNTSGQINGISRTSQLKFHPTDSTKMYAVSARGGLFISTNSGVNWTVAPGADKMPYVSLSSVCIDFTNDQIIYLGTGDDNYYGGGSGIWKSTDGGQNFSQIGLGGRLIIEMIMDPANNNSIVAATDGGIYKTTDGGNSWTLQSTARPFDDLKQKTPTSRVLYASTTDSAFFRSLDFGNSWTQITSGIVLPSGVTNGNGTRVAVSPADTNVVYLGLVSNGGMVYKSMNGGNSFIGVKTTSAPYLDYYSNLSTDPGQGDYNFNIGVDRTNANIIYLVAHVVWKSTNGGVSWNQLTNWWADCHTDMHQITTSPYNNSKLYNMNDGGVWLSTDGGNNWTPASDGLAGYEVYHGNCSPTRSDMISMGTQDNGELYATSTGWFTNRGGDWGSECAFDYSANSSMVYYYQNTNRRLVNGGDVTYGLPANVSQLNDISFHRSNPNLAFVADTIIYRTTNLSAVTPSWTPLLNTHKQIMAMHSAFANPNVLYIITNSDTLYVSVNALSATPVFTPFVLPHACNNAASITSMSNNSAIIYVTLNTKVYRSANNGATFTDITFNLPSVNQVKILSDEYYPGNELMLIASGNAVYYKIAAANAWTLFDNNLPQRTNLEDMSFYNDSTSNSLLRVATYGRGMWETPVTALRTLTANFIANNTNPCTDSIVTFSDLSTGNVISRNWTFTGGSPASSILPNPVVSYAAPGTYPVSLIVGDGSSTSTITKTAYISTYGSSLPLTQNFEGALFPPLNWTEASNGNSGIKWQLSTSASGYGLGAQCAFFDNYSNNTNGEKDEIRSMRVNGSIYNTITLTFDVAYWPFPGYIDSLQVLVSDDCGSSYTSVYEKGGSQLATVAGTTQGYFVPTGSQWRTDTINLTAFAGQTFNVSFRNIGGYSNTLYIDNININGDVAQNIHCCRASGAGRQRKCEREPRRRD